MWIVDGKKITPFGPIRIDQRCTNFLHTSKPIYVWTVTPNMEDSEMNECRVSPRKKLVAKLCGKFQRNEKLLFKSAQLLLDPLYEYIYIHL